MQVDLTDIVISLATLVGPVAAVLITRWLDDRRARRQRKSDIFTWYMLGRKAPVSPDFVKAMNLIDFEFQDEPNVIEAHDSVMNHFMMDMPISAMERGNFEKERERRLSELARALAGSVGIRLEKAAFKDGGYYPRGWDFEEERQRALRDLLISFLEGERPVHVIQGQSPFHDPKTPPRPTRPTI